MSAVCTDAGQTCIDTDVATPGTWVCSCVAPTKGTNGAQAPARCGTDECLAECATCAQGVCKEAGQDCFDPDLSVSSDWMCVCRGSTAKATGAAAVCGDAVVCTPLDRDACTAAEACVYDTSFGRCDFAKLNLTSAPLDNETNITNPNNAASVSSGEDDDCSFLECWWWLLLILLLLLSCSIIAAILLYRRHKKNEGWTQDNKYNRQFEQDGGKLDESEYGMVCTRHICTSGQPFPYPPPLSADGGKRL